MKRSAIKWTLILAVPAALIVWLALLTDGRGLWTRMGPFQGRVLNSKTKEPVQGAYVFLSWGATGLFGVQNCSAIHLVRSGPNGQYTAAWQGYRHLFAWGVTEWAPPTISVISEGYRPWGIRQDGPQDSSSYYFVPPDGTPYSVSKVHDIELTPMNSASYSDLDMLHLDGCVTSSRGKAIVAYLWMRSAWNERCHSGSATPMNPEEYIRFGSGFSDNTTVKTADSQITTIAAVRRQIQEATGFNEEMKSSGRTDLIPPFNAETRTKVCDLSNIRIPELEEAGQ